MVGTIQLHHEYANMNMQIFSNEAIQKRRIRSAAALDSLLPTSQALVVFSGEAITKPGGLDQTYPFLPHPLYFWLSGNRRHGSAVMYSKDTGWVEYILPVTLNEHLWEGAELLPQQGKGPQDLFQDLKTFTSVHVLGQSTTENQKIAKNSTAQNLFLLQKSLDEVRRVKDDEEIQLIQKAAQIAKQGYDRLQQIIRPDLTERDLQIEYEATIFRAGSHKLPYDTIVGSGKNAAVLHAIPTQKILAAGELILVDAGVDLDDYCVDITRVFPVSGSWNQQQRDLIQIVESAQATAIQQCRHGEEWSHVHRAAAQVIAEGLKSLNIMKGNAHDLLDSGAISVFFPHGVGHMVGLRVRDVGFQENLDLKKHCGVVLRVDMPILENHVMTVEPGCYFIPALLDDPATKAQYKEFIQWNEVEKWKNFGGVRIEDDVQITKSAAKNLTSGIVKI